MRVRGRSWVIGLAALAVAAAACSSATPSARSTSTSRPPLTTTTSSSTTTSGPPSTTTTSSAPQNLFASAADKEALTQAFVAYTHLPAPQIAGTTPGSVYYAYYPPTSTYWAVASFSPTASASTDTQVSLQDDGSIGIFSHTAGNPWTMLSNAPGIPVCWSRSAVPASVLALWGLMDHPVGCATTTTG